MVTWSRWAVAGPVASRPGAVRRIVLLGYMGTGKSTVGRALARRLGWRHLDFDREIERREGRRVAEIFHDEGELFFRDLEAALTEEVTELRRVVLSPGGGWITNPGVFERLQPGTLFVRLDASPEEVLARLARTRDERPLLAGPNPLSTIRRMLAEREPHYRRADLGIATDGRDVESIAAEIERRVQGALSAVGASPRAGPSPPAR
ncbi:shikimate kinase [soil metagenome]